MPLLRLACACFLAVGFAAATDADGDGLDDALEQQLLERFQPTLFVSATDCDGLPAEMTPGLGEPVVAARNGTLYGHVIRNGARIEVRYFHLWGRDCGRFGHALDAEHIAGLLEADHPDAPAGEWKAIAWYAGAHEDTMCELSTAAKASVLRAEHHGPAVWVSNGKHASYFDPKHCAAGCGGDVCHSNRRLRSPAIVNLGEAGKPLNGTAWLQYSKWPLAVKLRPDFTAELLAQLEPRSLVAARRKSPAMQGVVQVSNTTMNALDASGRKTGNALDRSASNTAAAVADATERTGSAVERSAAATGRSLDRAARSVRRFFGGK
ncbi:MAG: hypothetical protein K2X35_23700 [Bryobacteraceae bacterium]|nr:hypothetical protein [Bryobacteraceae bacterium]